MAEQPDSTLTQEAFLRGLFPIGAQGSFLSVLPGMWINF